AAIHGPFVQNSASGGIIVSDFLACLDISDSIQLAFVAYACIRLAGVINSFGFIVKNQEYFVADLQRIIPRYSEPGTMWLHILCYDGFTGESNDKLTALDVSCSKTSFAAYS